MGGLGGLGGLGGMGGRCSRCAGQRPPACRQGQQGRHGRGKLVPGHAGYTVPFKDRWMSELLIAPAALAVNKAQLSALFMAAAALKSALLGWMPAQP